MRSYVFWLILLFLPQFGCGGADEGRPPDSTSGALDGLDQCEIGEDHERFMLLDFEEFVNNEGNLQTNARCNTELLSQGAASSDPCSYFLNYDYASSPANREGTRVPVQFQERGEDCLELAVDEDATVFTQPRAGQMNIPTEVVGGRRCGEEVRAAHIITENVGMCYGSDGRLGWGAALDITFSGSLDASDWDGVSLWVKNNPGGEKQAFIMSFVDPITSGSAIDPNDPEGLKTTCDATDPAPGQSIVPDNEKCDAFGTAITLTDEWSFVPIRFDRLAQKGFGVVSTLGRLKTDEINRIQILIDAGNADFWIDDIALFRESE